MTFFQKFGILYSVEREEQVETASGFVPKKNKKAKLRENPRNYYGVCRFALRERNGPIELVQFQHTPPLRSCSSVGRALDF